jgi:hypothetical protein
MIAYFTEEPEEGAIGLGDVLPAVQEPQINLEGYREAGSSLAAYRNKVIEECAKGCDAEYRDPHNLPAAIVAKRCADTVRAMKEPE